LACKAETVDFAILSGKTCVWKSITII
jgi:hypothetical protein